MMSQDLEHFVLSVQELSSQGKLQQLADILSASQVLDTSQIPTSSLDNALETFNIYRHTLGVLHVLLAKYSTISVEDDYEQLFQQTRQFILGANPEQLPFASDQFAELCHRLTNQLVDRETPMKGIQLLQVAIGKVQAAPSQLTPVHADLCQLCLLAKCFSPVIRFLDVDITDVLSRNAHTSGPPHHQSAHHQVPLPSQPHHVQQYNAAYLVKSVLLFFYYGGMIFAALRKLDRAVFLFEAAVTVDAMVLSHIALEAYKKRILVSLIAYGRVEALPPWTSHVVERFARQLSKVYHDFETAYAASSLAGVQDIWMKNSDQFVRDGNGGLVKQCIASLTRKNIKKLTRTFVTLSLADVAQRCQLADARQAERQLFAMIEDGEIFASINQKDGMVVFKDNPDKFNNAQCFLDLERKMLRYIEINEKVRQLSEEILLDPRFIQKSTTQEDDITGMAGPSGSPGTSGGGGGSARSPSGSKVYVSTGSSRGGLSAS